MTKISAKIILSTLLGLGSITSIFGQISPQLQTDQSIQYRSSQSFISPNRNGTPDTLSLSSSQPFLDDFSYSGLRPDSTKWFVPISDTHVPVITRGFSIAPPSLGALTFDGATHSGLPYNTSALSTSKADRLISHYIDLTNFDEGDKIKLSFFLQAKGHGEAPEASDSFFVYFQTPFAPPMDFQKVLAVGGGSDSTFTPYIISVDQPEFFHTKFQIIFEAVGSQNGYLDHWHLDNVYLGLNRDSSDIRFADRSPTFILQSPLAPYTAIPVQHFQGNSNLMQPFEVQISNTEDAMITAPIKASISDPIGSSITNTPFDLSSSVSLSPFSSSNASFNAFGEQNINQIAAIQLNVEVDQSDLYTSNNQLETTYRIDSIFAYDDGEADRSFGFNRARGFGVEYNLPQDDSLVAVWISFVPTVNFNPVSNKVTYMSEKSFRLVVYKNPHPDSILLQKIGGMKVQYGDKTDHFERYALDQPLAVPQTFWVGIQQTDELPIGVGFDENYDNSAKIFWDSSGYWRNIEQNGSLLIRPEMYNTASYPASNESFLSFNPGFSISPNPVRGREINIEVKTENPQFYYSGKLMDLTGREVFILPEKQIIGKNIKVNLPNDLGSGVYYWIHQMQAPRGKRINYTEKILIFN